MASMAVLAAVLNTADLSRAAEPEVAAVPVRAWKAIGPFGDRQLKDRPREQHPQDGAHNFVNRVFASAKYPVEKQIDLDAVYTGDLTVDVNGKEHELRWTNLTATADVVEFKPLPAGKGAPGANDSVVGLVYFSTWVFAPAEMTVAAQFPAYQGIPRYGATEHVWINGQLVKQRQEHPDNKLILHPVEKQSIALKNGWNHVLVKVWSTWAGAKAGLVLQVPAAKAFDFKFSAEPPKEVGRKFTIDGAKAE